MSKVSPVFIFSLPRSGSTLLQRILTTHDEVCSTSEPWVLLPSFISLDESISYGPYRHRTMARAINDFCQVLPEKYDTYYKYIAQNAESLYCEASSGDSKYFIDKTPRYHLIADHIVNAFPDAKFIFLWRNPLAIVSSIVDTFCGGKWKVSDYTFDLYRGLQNLTDLAFSMENRAVMVRYEDLVTNIPDQLDKLGSYLGLRVDGFKPEAIRNYVFKGRMGDPSGVKAYHNVSIAPVEKWKDSIDNAYRSWWCKSYIEWVGRERLKRMGYDYLEIVSALESVDSVKRRMLSDIYYDCAYRVNNVFELRLLLSKVRAIVSGKRVYSIY